MPSYPSAFIISSKAAASTVVFVSAKFTSSISSFLLPVSGNDCPMESDGSPTVLAGVGMSARVSSLMRALAVLSSPVYFKADALSAPPFFSAYMRYPFSAFSRM